MPDHKLVTNEICDLCWDDEKKETPAITMATGIPLCGKHLEGMTSKRFGTKRKFCKEVECINPVLAIDGQYCAEHSVSHREEAKIAPKVANESTVTIPATDAKKSVAPLNDLEPKSAQVARRGITTGADFSQFMAALMEDLVEGKIKPDVAGAACTAGGKLLQMVEMQMKYRSSGRILKLTEGNSDK